MGNILGLDNQSVEQKIQELENENLQHKAFRQTLCYQEAEIIIRSLRSRLENPYISEAEKKDLERTLAKMNKSVLWLFENFYKKGYLT